jgi:hypothetical protein
MGSVEFGNLIEYDGINCDFLHGDIEKIAQAVSSSLSWVRKNSVHETSSLH